jgi:hypothetical protein
MSRQPEKPTDAKAIDELANLYQDRNAANSLFEVITFPRNRIPPFGVPIDFWRTIGGLLQGGILPGGGGLRPLIQAAADMFPGNEILRAWLGADAPRVAPTADGGATILLSTNADVFEVIELARGLAQQRGLPGRVDMLYASGENVGLYLNGADTEQALRLSNALFETLNGRLLGRPRVIADQIRDYLIGRLFVEGPDSDRFEFKGVPASTPIRDIARALMDQYDDEVRPRDRQGQPRPTVVNHVQANGKSHRVAPEKTLREAGIGEDATLRVASESTAGAMVDAQVREDALARVRSQVLAYAAGHPGFLVSANATQAPTEYLFKFRAPGWGPPRTTGGEPEPVDQHEVYLLLSPDFPVLAPLAIWQTDIFHPNVDARNGKVCLGALEDRYRPGINFAEVCQMLVDIAGYQNYELREYYNKEAQEWADSPEGQRLIEARGGKSTARSTQDVDYPLPLRVKRCES